MTREKFLSDIDRHHLAIAEIRESAWQLHASVGQTYDNTHPYGYHLSMVADAAVRFGHVVMADESDELPVVFAAYYHDSIEDARLSYNDVLKTALRYMTRPQAISAAEVVYALTNEKGRTREERAGARYYAGIRQVPYAPFVKLCDRLANMTYSARDTNDANNHMLDVYAHEWPHFLESINAHNDDIRFALPTEMIREVELLLHDEV
ncbi:MAG: hypothetical protein HUK03_05255 [Bacteroidaceae bacterium]|nr:hypothetical protein [Bacteroidaceae bacterium]